MSRDLMPLPLSRGVRFHVPTYTVTWDDPVDQEQLSPEKLKEISEWYAKACMKKIESGMVGGTVYHDGSILFDLMGA